MIKTNFDEKQEKIKVKFQESEWKYKVALFKYQVALFTVTGLELSHCKLQIAISFQKFAMEIMTS